MPDIEFTDRYGGGPYPDPKTMCTGQCEGLGFYPQQINSLDDASEYERAEVARVLSEGTQDTSDGWAFIRCEICGGTGKKPTETP